MKQVVELQDGECFVHRYDALTVHRVVRQQCEGGGDTGVLDAVITTEVGRLEDGKFISRPTGREERCNPYANVSPVECVATEMD